MLGYLQFGGGVVVYIGNTGYLQFGGGVVVYIVNRGYLQFGGGVVVYIGNTGYLQFGGGVVVYIVNTGYLQFGYLQFGGGVVVYIVNTGYLQFGGGVVVYIVNTGYLQFGGGVVVYIVNTGYLQFGGGVVVYIVNTGYLQFGYLQFGGGVVVYIVNTGYLQFGGGVVVYIVNTGYLQFGGCVVVYIVNSGYLQFGGGVVVYIVNTGYYSLLGVGGHANGGMMSFVRNMFAVFLFLLTVYGNSVSQNQSVSKEHTCVCDPPDCGPLNDEKYCRTLGKCYAHKQLVNGEYVIVRNCFGTVEHSYLNCNSNIEGTLLKCCEGHLCNVELTMEPIPDSVVEKDEMSFVVKLIIGSTAVILASVILLLLVVFGRHLYYKHRAEGLLPSEARLLEDDSMYRGFQDGLKQDQWSTGSGSGQPILVRRTVGKQVTLFEKIGKGRFGEVWRGKWLDEDVAVKTFSSIDETSWNHETEIYNTGMLRHENILGYYASDTVGILSCTQNWLIVHYHHNGSLYDYLQRSDIDMEEMLTLAHSAAAGLAHLHNEIKEGTGKHEKPAIAHRDLKSKNILVKDNGQCCLGDLGHAVRSDKMESDVDLTKLRVGTKRYMAPEVLTESLNPAYFESFKCADVYSFGLVLWEIARRARPFAEEYRVPFWDVVPADPGFDDMLRVVAEEQQRPPIPNKWSKEPLMCEMAKIICECWTQNPKSRLTILRVKKNLFNLLKLTTGERAEKTEKLCPKIVDSSSGSSSGNSSGNFSVRS
ncbi:Activin receptor type-1 [Bulinus truncatus]|nr:Activin receptor type-1 [Bulinus truncatus]